jgi:hypothetical protein
MTEKTADSKFSEGQFISGYRIQRIANIDSLQCVLTELVHEATGARHIHLSNSDRENAFGVVFKTVPRNSTGVAHILEHTALCGSQKYPVRDPFFSMLKRSLSTFMNAFTASDWTMYPFATQIEKDYYNLMGVYLDAAFFPVLDELSFMQEGHRLSLVPDPENPEVPRLIFTGVVYNEMKGAMSSPSQVMARSLLNALYPDTTYRFNSGGEPRDIPSLTWQNLKDFHARHYHPSNAWFYTYGNLPLVRHLEFISQTVLYRFERIQPDTDVPSQPRWTSPRSAEYTYALNQPEDISQKHQICLAWLLADIQDTFGILSLALLNEVLLGNAASPLKKALIDSGLGSSLSDGSGLDADNRDIFFSCGLKDVRAENVETIQKIILDTLSRLTDAGIDRDLIESALHQIEFHRKEVVNTPYPHGLRLLLGMTGTWIHGGDPVRLLNIDADIERLRRQAMTESLLENVIKRYFLENPHRVRLTLVPDSELAERERQRESADLARIQSLLLPEQIQGIIDSENCLQQRQETLENVSCLPTLKKEDIPPDIVKIHETSRSLKLDSRTYEQPTAGIVYVSAVAGAGMLSEDALPLVPIFCHCLTRIGSARHDYVEISRLIDRYTGGMGASPQARTGFDASAQCLPMILMNAKCLNRNLDPMLELIQELICETRFDDLARLKNLLLEYRAGMESMIVENGHRLAISLSTRRFSLSSALGEIWGGVHQYRFIRSLTETLSDSSLQNIANCLSDMASQVFCRSNIRLAFIGESAPLSRTVDYPGRLYENLIQDGVPGFGPPAVLWQGDNPREGWATDTAVSFVAQSFETVRMDHEDAAALSLIARMLRSLYLHREIREKGGAYGGFALYGGEDGLFSFASYRDPHIAATLTVYRNAMDFIRSGHYTDEDIHEGILQVCADIDKPDPPGPAARKAFLRELVFLTDDVRSRFKSRLLSLTRNDVIRVAERYFNPDDRQCGIAVISNETRLKSPEELLQDQSPLTIYKV